MSDSNPFFSKPHRKLQQYWSFQWYWILNAGSPPYTSCWDALVEGEVPTDVPPPPTATTAPPPASTSPPPTVAPTYAPPSTPPTLPPPHLTSTILYPNPSTASPPPFFR